MVVQAEAFHEAEKCFQAQTTQTLSKFKAKDMLPAQFQPPLEMFIGAAPLQTLSERS